MRAQAEAGRFERAIKRFDQENSLDPNEESVNESNIPRELAHAQWLSDWVLKLDPNASEALRLAARCQHICRWKIPRAEFPADRAGYHKWRTRLKQFHAEISAKILVECGYDEQTITRVRALNLKHDFPTNPDSQILEDALCLVFLERQFAELARKLDHEKMINALRKSWGKMSDKARRIAGTLTFEPFERQLLSEALAGEYRGSTTK